MKGLDLLLINPIAKKRVYQELSKDFSAVEPPFWAAIMAGYIRNKNFNVDILDANAENLDFIEVAKQVEKYNPQLTNIVVYGQHPSASTALMPSVRRLCEEIKKENPERKIILTGLHPSALPRKTIEEESCDFIGEGEGFYTLQGLLEKKDFEKIPGLWYKKENKIFSTNRADLITNLTEEINDVAWDLLPMKKYKAHNWHCLGDLNSRENYAAISTSLGCPYHCEFCCINAPFGKSAYREWNPKWVLKQIDTLVKKYDVKNIKIIDELFVLNPNHFLPITEGLIKRDYGLNIWSYARIDTAKKEYLSPLKKAGINWLGVGIESGDEEVRKDVSKGKFGSKKITEAVNQMKDNGIYVAANYIFGLPEDDKESMQKTFELAKELNCEWANFYCAMAYPGSKLHKQCVEEKIVLPEDKMGPGWIGYSQHSYETFPLSTKKLSAGEVLKFRDESFQKYFTSPKYLNMIESKFGKGAKEHIQEMTKIKLKRKILENQDA